MRDTWRHRRDVDVARDANANNAKIIKDVARAPERRPPNAGMAFLPFVTCVTTDDSLRPPVR